MISISCLALTRASHRIDSHRTQLISTVITNYSHIAPGHGCAQCALIHCCEVIFQKGACTWDYWAQIIDPIFFWSANWTASWPQSHSVLMLSEHHLHLHLMLQECFSMINKWHKNSVLIISCHGYIFMSRFSVIKTIKRKTDGCCSVMLPWRGPDINKLHKHARVPQVSLRQHPTRSNDFIQSRNRNIKGPSAWNEWNTGCSVHLGVKRTSANNRICSVNLFDDHLTFNYSFCPPGALMDFLFWS